METVTLDFDQLMERLHVGFADKWSHGEIVSIPDWTREQALAAFEIVKREILPLQKPVLVKKHPARWIFCSILDLLYPLGVAISQHDGSVAELKCPQCAQPSTLTVRTEEIPDGLRVRYALPGSDDVKRDYAINFSHLGALYLPPLPDGKDLFVQTLGSSAVPVGMTLCYGPSCRSLWIAEPDEAVYYCALSHCGQYRIGDCKEL